MEISLQRPFNEDRQNYTGYKVEIRWKRFQRLGIGILDRIRA